ncbi:EF-hand domain protein [Theileria parva strain Muguga]|uniref:EF-hand domain protein n=1 Tax=Theileria parva strain Muguga TaxID=333668 RepID=UPI001C61B015|nr:EF-hand domain protein [Theileria parva strain Muguga]KAF5153320.1 EF-hand domain protein [Theileria parva strain Muguga]
MASEAGSNVELLFSSYSDERGYVPSSVLNELVCELGYAPSLKEMSDFKQKTGGQCDLTSFKAFLKTIVHPEDTHANLTELFRFYDPNNTGRISKKQLERLLTNVGEYLSETEIERFFSVLCNETDEVDYEDLVNKLLLK